MFVRTPRLLLRPGFIEDAPALAAAIGDEAIARNLARLPWPYGVDDARTWLSQPADPLLPSMLMIQRTEGTPRIVGGIGIHRIDDAAGAAAGLEIGYWVARPFWGLGFATEAGRAMLGLARAHGLPRLASGHFIDNPKSGAVLRKLGFRPTGRIVPRYSLARGCDVACALFEEGEDAGTGDMPPRLADDLHIRDRIRLLAA